MTPEQSNLAKLLAKMQVSSGLGAAPAVQQPQPPAAQALVASTVTFAAAAMQQQSQPQSDASVGSTTVRPALLTPKFFSNQQVGSCCDITFEICSHFGPLDCIYVLCSISVFFAWFLPAHNSRQTFFLATSGHQNIDLILFFWELAVHVCTWHNML
jgi:hypothetical protein